VHFLFSLFAGRNAQCPALATLFKIPVSKDCFVALLPADVWALLLSWLQPPDLLSLARVSKFFSLVASSDRVWQPIFTHAGRYFPSATVQRVEQDPDKPMSYKQLTRIAVTPVVGKYFNKDGLQRIKMVVVGDGAVGKCACVCVCVCVSPPLCADVP
jgi:hypothetical protein